MNCKIVSYDNLASNHFECICDGKYDFIYISIYNIYREFRIDPSYALEEELKSLVGKEFDVAIGIITHIIASGVTKTPENEYRWRYKEIECEKCERHYCTCG